MSEEVLGDEVPDKLFFRIGEAAQIVGVEPHVLRYWESEFKLRPQRSGSGQRMYRRKDLGKLLRIRKLLHEEGFTIAGARKALSAPTAATPAAGGAGHANNEQVAQARERIDALRKRIASARSRFSAVMAEPGAT